MTNDIEMKDLSKKRKTKKPNKSDTLTLRFGPNQKRSCTDVLCLCFFILFIVGWGFMIFFFSNRIDFEQTIYPSNTYGEICGKGSQAGKPYLVFFNIFKCVASPELSIVEGCKTPSVCVENCPHITFSINKEDSYNVRQKQADLAICLPKIKPTAKNILNLTTQGLCARYYFNSDSIGGRCIPSIVKIFSDHIILDEIKNNGMVYENGSVIMAESLIKNNEIISSLIKGLNIGIKAIKDIARTWRWILIGLVEVTILTILWIYFLQHAAYIVTWITIITLLTLNTAGLWFSYQHYQSFDKPINHTVEELINARSAIAASNPHLQLRSMNYVSLDKIPSLDNSAMRYLAPAKKDLSFELDLTEMLKDNLNEYLNRQSTWKWISIILAIILAILFLILFCLISRIQLACAVIQESGKAVMQMKSTLFFPIVPFMFYLLCFVGAAIAIMIISAGTHSNYRYPNETLCSPVDLDEFHSIEIGINHDDSFKEDKNCKLQKTPFNRKTVYSAHALNLFGIIWVMFFLNDLCFSTLSGTFSTWYWTFHKSEVPFFSLLASFKTIFVYHLGSIAFGSLIISIVRFIRIILEFIDEKCKKYADYTIVKWIIWACKCCFWCLEIFIRFINRNAYIYMAMFGTSFMESARKAFRIIAENPVRAIVLSYLSDFLFFISRIVLTSVVGVTGYFLLTNHFPTLVVFDLQYYWAPLAAFLFLSYILTGALFGVYQVAIETIFFCYLKDSEENDGSAERPFYMSTNLAKILGRRNRPSVEANRRHL